jgi:hypothetical protein
MSADALPLAFDLAGKMEKIDIWMLGTINMSSLKQNGASERR